MGVAKGGKALVSVLSMIFSTLGWTGAASAQDFPTKPIEIYVGSPAGGETDNLARTVATYAAPFIGQEIVVVNKPGASGTIASQYVASATPDGYTLFMGGGSETVAVGNFRELSFHPINDFEPIIRFIRSPIVLSVAADAPWKTVQDFIEDAKANPGKYSYATSGVGSILHAAMLILEQRTGVKLRHVPFKGGAETVTALLGGHVNVATSGTSEIASVVEGGLVRQLAIFSDTRSSVIPDVPTMRELGYDISVDNTKGLLAPKGTPPDVIKKLHDGFQKMMENPEFTAAMEKMRLDIAYLDSKTFGETLSRTYDAIGESLKASEQ